MEIMITENIDRKPFGYCNYLKFLIRRCINFNLKLQRVYKILTHKYFLVMELRNKLVTNHP